MIARPENHHFWEQARERAEIRIRVRRTRYAMVGTWGFGFGAMVSSGAGYIPSVAVFMASTVVLLFLDACNRRRMRRCLNRR